MSSIRRISVLITGILFCSLSALVRPSGAQPWQHAFGIGSAGNDPATRLALDSSSDHYTTGVFRGTLKMGADTLTSPDAISMYVAKFDASGQLLWAKLIGTCTDSLSRLDAFAIEVDREGRAFVAGRLVGSATLAGTVRTSVGFSDVLVLSLNADGTVRWARTAGGVGLGNYWQPAANALALDASDNVYLTGSYNSVLDVDAVHLTSDNTNELFILKFDADGTTLWGKSGSGFGAHTGAAITCDAQGHIAVAGSFFGTINLDATTIDAGDAEQKIFVMALEGDGTMQWSERLGSGGYYGFCTDMTNDAEGNLYLCGGFRADIAIGTHHYRYNNNYQYAALIAKCDHSGIVNWAAMPQGANQYSIARSVALGRSGNTLVAGTFTDTVAFGPQVLERSGGNACYLATLDRNGEFTFAISTGGNGRTIGSGVVCTPSGEIILLGQFSDTANFSDQWLVSNGGNDVFLVSLPPDIANVGGPQHGVRETAFYPNPARNTIYVNSTTGYVLTDLLGRTLTWCSDCDRIDVSALPSGSYMLNGHLAIVMH